MYDRSQSKNEYLRRIHKVQDYIDANLCGSLMLEDLADIAGFSKYHFHRIFKGIIKESLLQYVNRQKLEKSLYFLLYRHDLTITDIAYNFGFSDAAIFSRAFKNCYQVSPNYYRNYFSKNCKDSEELFPYNKDIARAKLVKWGSSHSVSGNVTIETIDEIYVAYVRHLGTYEDLESFFLTSMKELFEQLRELNLYNHESTKVMAVYHDNPEITEDKNRRTSLCITIPTSAIKTIETLKSNIGTMMIPSGKYAVGRFEIYQNEYGEAWDYLCGGWLPQSGLLPRDASAFEVYLSEPDSDPQKKQLVDMYLPVEPLA